MLVPPEVWIVTFVLWTVPTPVPEASVPTARLPSTGVAPPPASCAVPPLLTMTASPATGTAAGLQFAAVNQFPVPGLTHIGTPEALALTAANAIPIATHSRRADSFPGLRRGAFDVVSARPTVHSPWRRGDEPEARAAYPSRLIACSLGRMSDDASDVPEAFSLNRTDT